MTQKHKNARSDEYATRSDFCRIYLEQMNSIYLLSLLLTADPQKAEQCFVVGFDDSVNNKFVFKERANLWARRRIILHAIRSLCPRADRGWNHRGLDTVGSLLLTVYSNSTALTRQNAYSPQIHTNVRQILSAPPLDVE